jgi:hypothetical protein
MHTQVHSYRCTELPTAVKSLHMYTLTHTSQRSSYPHPVLPVRQQPSRPYPPTTRTQVQPVHLAVLSNGRMRHEHTYTRPPTSSQPSLFRAAATSQYYVYIRYVPSPRPPRHALFPLLSNNDLPPTCLYQPSITYIHHCSSQEISHAQTSACRCTHRYQIAAAHAYAHTRLTLALNHQTQHIHPYFRIFATLLHLCYIPYFLVTER